MKSSAQKATWGQHLGLWSYKVLCLILRICDIRIVATIGRLVGYLVWAMASSRRRIVERNLRIVVDPTLRKDKLNSMVRRNIVRTSMNLACSLKTGLMTAKEMERSIRMEGADFFEESGMNGHTVISCIPHAGNWEILARIRPHFTRVEHFGSMYRRMSNPLLEQMVYASRTAYGCEMFSKEDGLRSALKLARTGGLLGVLSDQFTQEGLFLPYFGKMTGVTPLPALIYKRCKGKGALFSVFTRNTGLGKWDAVLGRKIELKEPCDTLAEITVQVNHALEACQKENIIDGFWMHHRWKPTGAFAPQQEPDVEETAAAHTRLPFRIIVCMPEAFEEALCVLPALRALKGCRFDIQLTIVCPTEQQAFWQQQPEVTYTATTDGAQNVFEQLDADEIYKDGPFDYLYMFSENRRVWKLLQRLAPLYVSGFADNPLARKKRAFRSMHTVAPMGVQDRCMDYLDLLEKQHRLPATCAARKRKLCAARPGNPEARGDFFAPFSTLGAADSWPEERWQQLVQKLPNGATLLVLPQDKQRAEAMASRLGVTCCCVKPEEVATVLGPDTRLFAVDGLLPQLAAACGATCRTIMASRDSQRYQLQGDSRSFKNHVPCHPCYRSECDAATPCTHGISVEDLLS